ncbi:hypothetical protein CEXT_406561 [Caerostris extrusa]|uniref:Uncharacterized protein n=1 Tax=Caerostris extrusa TaxID=172846 RepID=A0AAV4VM69_CAEEX|nr:hypothetical protein CEXT_406561 [Caerostris extrusa]
MHAGFLKAPLPCLCSTKGCFVLSSATERAFWASDSISALRARLRFGTAIDFGHQSARYWEILLLLLGRLFCLLHKKRNKQPNGWFHFNKWTANRTLGSRIQGDLFDSEIRWMIPKNSMSMIFL